MLFAAIGMIAVLTAGVGMFMRGPVTSVSNVTRYNIAKNDMQAAVALISQVSLNNPAADCDADGKIEPLPFRAGAAAYPAGGGVLPDGVGANRRDPWGTDYGYCVWDYGTKTVPDDIPACGGAGANRRAGGNTSESTVIAVITAGPEDFPDGLRRLDGQRHARGRQNGGQR